MKRTIIAIVLLLQSFLVYTVQAQIPENDVTDAYVYLLGRVLVIRQEHIDIKEPGVDYNVVKYNLLGSADFVNPNLDVAYLEAWIAVDDKTPVVLDVPPVKDRYYTAQICDEWDEVITNINERNYPKHAYGKFAFVAPGSKAKIPNGAVRVELHSNKAKMLARVELKTDPDGAAKLQRQFKLTPMGKPEIKPAVPIPMFGNKELLGVEIFDNVEAILTSASDFSPVAAEMQQKVRAVAEQAAINPEERARFDKLIREKVVPELLNYAVTKAGTYKNNWLGTLTIGNYGKNYWVRTAANLVGIWANSADEVIYFVATRDANGKPLNGRNHYVIHFPKVQLPEAVVNSYWSVILVDIPDYRVVPNPLARFNLNSYSGLKSEPDGSLKIYVAPELRPGTPKSNWLPSPKDKPFSLTFRTYVPKDKVKRGEWFPPALKQLD